MIDPVTAEVVRSGMETVCFEMATHVSRTATTPTLNQSNERNATQPVYEFGGGGGWGDPFDRDPQMVLEDVWDEYVSVEGARRDYGMVLTGSLEDMTLALDDAATTAERTSRRLDG